MLLLPFLLLFLPPAAPPAPELDLTVRYMFYACDPCPYEYRVERSATRPGQPLVGNDVAIVYQGQPLGETAAFPAGVTPQHNRLRVWGRLQPRKLTEYFSGERTITATKVRWLR